MIKVQNTRKIKEILDAKPTVEGAGVCLNRFFSQPEIPRLDPFLLLDGFSSPNPLDYLPAKVELTVKAGGKSENEENLWH